MGPIRSLSDVFRRRRQAAVGALRVVGRRLGADSRADRWAPDAGEPAEKIGTMPCNDVVLAVARMKFRKLAEERRRGSRPAARR